MVRGGLKSTMPGPRIRTGCTFPLTTFESEFARDRGRLAERAPRVQRRARRRAFAPGAGAEVTAADILNDIQSLAND